MKKIAIICDIHLPEREDASQYAALQWAVGNIAKNKVDALIVAGDITATGERNAANFFEEQISNLQCEKIVLLGNSDVRTPENYEYISNLKKGDGFMAGNRQVFCLNTPFGTIEQKDRDRLGSSGNNAVVVLHHTLTTLDSDSREFLIGWASKKVGLILQAHSHRIQNFYISNTEVIGLCALDPDKAIGTPPGITYLELEDKDFSLYREYFDFDIDNLSDFQDFLGISCFNPETDIDYARERGIKNIEIRKYDFDEPFFEMVAHKVEKWRKSGGKCLSIHMPNLWWKEELVGLKEWEGALQLYKRLEADSLTIHVPRIGVRHMGKDNPIREMLIDFMVSTLKELSPHTAVAIENLHTQHGERDDENRAFGYVPEEIEQWINDINKKMGYERVGHLLDVGHARNNAPFNSKYTVSVWYSMIGNKTQAYHIHQVKNDGEGSPNHKAIADWYGPLINYTSFFWAWQHNQLNHKPAFLEVKNIENCEKSLVALEEIMKKWKKSQ